MPYVTVNDRRPRPRRLLVLSAQVGGDARVAVGGWQNAGEPSADPGGRTQAGELESWRCGETRAVRHKRI